MCLFIRNNFEETNIYQFIKYPKVEEAKIANGECLNFAPKILFC